MNNHKTHLTHAAFIALELFVAPAIALNIGYGIAISDPTSDLITILISSLIISSSTFLGLVAIIGYIHFKRIGHTDFMPALFRGTIAEIIIVPLCVYFYGQDTWFPAYGIIFITVIGTVAAFNSVLSRRRSREV